MCITETWLSDSVPDSSVLIPGYNLLRKDRVETSGGGVCIFVDSEIPYKHIEYFNEDGVESIWISMRPHRLPRQVTSIDHFSGHLPYN